MFQLCKSTQTWKEEGGVSTRGRIRRPAPSLSLNVLTQTKDLDSASHLENEEIIREIVFL